MPLIKLISRNFEVPPSIESGGIRNSGGYITRGSAAVHYQSTHNEYGGESTKVGTSRNLPDLPRLKSLKDESRGVMQKNWYK